MRDLIFIGYILGLMLLAFKRPFLFTLIYAYLDIVSPQRLSYFLLNSIPLSLIVFGLAFSSFLLIEDKRNVRFAPRIALMIILIIYCGITTLDAEEPIAAQEKWAWVWKALLFASFLPLTLHTKLRLEALILTMVVCISTLIVTGGIKTLAGGGGYGVLVILINNNSGLFEGSTISCVAIAIIPLILWLRTYGTVFMPSKLVTLYAIALIGACLLIPVGTNTRTGLICIGVLAILMLRFARYRMLYAMGAVALALAAIPFLPDSVTKRADTIQNYKADESASTRIQVWSWTIEFVKTHPFGGGFEVYRQNSIRYRIPITNPEEIAFDGKTSKEIVDKGRAFHSSYFEMLGEQGYPGLILWLMINIGGLFRMEVIQRLYRRRARADEKWVAPLAIALQNGQVIFMFGSLFVGLAFQPFFFMLVGLQIGLDTYLKRRRQEAATRPIVG